jgi:FeS assembly SUF system protein
MMSDEPKPASVPPTAGTPTPGSPTPDTPKPAPEHLAERDETTMNNLERNIVSAMETIFDPEIPVNIVELGLIYGVEVDKETGNVDIEMTLTTPACPVAGTLPGEVETKVKTVEGVNEVVVELVWDPPWSMERLSEAAKLTLGVG